MATIFRGKLADERRFPYRFEAVLQAGFAEAGIAHVDKDHDAVFADADFMKINRSESLHIARDIDFVMFLLANIVTHDACD